MGQIVFLSKVCLLHVLVDKQKVRAFSATAKQAKGVPMIGHFLSQSLTCLHNLRDFVVFLWQQFLYHDRTPWYIWDIKFTRKESVIKKLKIMAFKYVIYLVYCGKSSSAGLNSLYVKDFVLRAFVGPPMLPGRKHFTFKNISIPGSISIVRDRCVHSLGMHYLILL